MVFIYILQCEQRNYYVGKTENPKIRIDNHFDGKNSSAWTTMYKPIELIKLFEGDKYDEDKYTLIYMEKYGIDNVRGGSYTQLKLNDQQIDLIEQQILSANDRCRKCGMSGHYIKDCDQNINYRASYLRPNCRVIIHDLINKPEYNYNEAVTKSYDNERKRWKIKLKDGQELYIKEQNLLLNEPGITGTYIKPNDTSLVSQILSYIFEEAKCNRCGRTGHYEYECYARKHIKGYYLK